jgi:hypothetical protein
MITFGGAVESDVIDAADKAVVLDVRLDRFLPVTQLCELSVRQIVKYIIQ